MNKVVGLTFLAFCLMGLPAFPAEPEELVLFDFEDTADLIAWTNLELPDTKEKDREPAARIERSTEMVTSGKYSLKITFGGGSWPTLTTSRAPDDWNAWHTLKADVSVSRPFWTNGEHPNHGFMLHGDSTDYMTCYTRETKDIKNRPAVLVIHEPK